MSLTRLLLWDLVTHSCATQGLQDKVTAGWRPTQRYE